MSLFQPLDEHISALLLSLSRLPPSAPPIPSAGFARDCCWLLVRDGLSIHDCLSVRKQDVASKERALNGLRSGACEGPGDEEERLPGDEEERLPGGKEEGLDVGAAAKPSRHIRRTSNPFGDVALANTDAAPGHAAGSAARHVPTPMSAAPHAHVEEEQGGFKEVLSEDENDGFKHVLSPLSPGAGASDDEGKVALGVPGSPVYNPFGDGGWDQQDPFAAMVGGGGGNLNPFQTPVQEVAESTVDLSEGGQGGVEDEEQGRHAGLEEGGDSGPGGDIGSEDLEGHGLAEGKGQRVAEEEELLKDRTRDGESVCGDGLDVSSSDGLGGTSADRRGDEVAGIRGDVIEETPNPFGVLLKKVSDDVLPQAADGGEGLPQAPVSESIEPVCDAGPALFAGLLKPTRVEGGGVVASEDSSRPKDDRECGLGEPAQHAVDEHGTSPFGVRSVMCSCCKQLSRVPCLFNAVFRSCILCDVALLGAWWHFRAPTHAPVFSVACCFRLKKAHGKGALVGEGLGLSGRAGGAVLADAGRPEVEVAVKEVNPFGVRLKKVARDKENADHRLWGVKAGETGCEERREEDGGVECAEDMGGATESGRGAAVVEAIKCLEEEMGEGEGAGGDSLKGAGEGQVREDQDEVLDEGEDKTGSIVDEGSEAVEHLPDTKAELLLGAAVFGEETGQRADGEEACATSAALLKLASSEETGGASAESVLDLGLALPGLRDEGIGDGDDGKGEEAQGGNKGGGDEGDGGEVGALTSEQERAGIVMDGLVNLLAGDVSRAEEEGLQACRGRQGHGADSAVMEEMGKTSCELDELFGVGTPQKGTGEGRGRPVMNELLDILSDGGGQGDRATSEGGGTGVNAEAKTQDALAAGETLRGD
jgi:hypothetical protein